MQILVFSAQATIEKWMDEEPGNVIDGTARARHWRRSQPKSGAGADGRQNHSEAPKSIAASLLVPPALEGELASPLTHERGNGNGGGDSRSMDRTSADTGLRNIFLSSDAAVPAPPTRRPMRIPAVALSVARRASVTRRRIADVRLPWPEFSLPRARTAGVLGLVAACAVAAAALALAWQPSSPPRSRSIGHADGVFGIDRLKERLLLPVESAFAVVSTKTQPRASVTPMAARHSAPRVRHVRERAARVASAQVASRAESASRPAHTTSGAAAVTRSASRASSTTAVSETPAQQSPTQQTHPQPQVHYQPPPQPSGPAGLGSQVGSNCNPKCS